jgi:hypothetical protein
MDMKNTKAIFFIVLGAFLIATGFAFAGESDTYTKVANDGGVKAWNTVNPEAPAVKFDGATTDKSAGTKKSFLLKAAAASPSVPAVKAAATPPAPEPTAKEKMDKFLKDNMPAITLSAVGAFCGFALFGPIGILMGAAFMFAINYCGNVM